MLKLIQQMHIDRKFLLIPGNFRRSRSEPSGFSLSPDSPSGWSWLSGLKSLLLNLQISLQKMWRTWKMHQKLSYILYSITALASLFLPIVSSHLGDSSIQNWMRRKKTPLRAMKNSNLTMSGIKYTWKNNSQYTFQKYTLHLLTRRAMAMCPIFQAKLPIAKMYGRYLTLHISAT